MLRNTMAALAIALLLGSSAHPTSAFARNGGDNHLAGGFRGARVPGDGYGGYDDRARAHGLRGRFHGDRHGDVWGHWGAYYGPMIAPF
jgi:hypothetical protein